ncbi:hypothetical protein RHSIM_Rhsim10G0126100 [Rhododendron simsii]|uniref:CCHC-type domain-containing protein n=1 Tax=Rhododendron simsii TaxID=118357 RepID=A0A834GEQ7_RHOSS|nr:hypothetical protein RHSIM_Rhsim10G0126100 [Rhododendron simsii]
MSLIAIGDMVEKLGYLGMINYYYVMTGKNINNGLRMLLTNSDVMEMIDQLPPSRIVDMYVEPITPIEMMESQTDKGGPTATPTLTPTDKGVSTNTDNGVPTNTDKGVPTNTDKRGPTDKGGPSVQDLGDTTSDSDMSFEVDSDYEQSDDDGLYEANVDEKAEWAGFDNKKGKQPDLNADLDDDDGIDYGDDSSDDLHSACSNSDDNGRKDKFHEYRRETDLGKVQISVKTHTSEHGCLRSFKVRHVTSKYLAEKYVDSITSNPDMPLEHLQQRVRKDLVGLVPALQTMVRNAEMRFCTKKLYTNFRDEHKGMELRKQLWAAARATTVPDFQKAMDIMRSTDVEVYNWLAEIPATLWFRSHFSTFNNCDILVNNLYYCHPCYGKETNASIYKGVIYPINGWTMWPSSGYVPVLPPNYGRSASRPKKSRRREREELENPDADKLKRQNTSLRYGKCGRWGHNMRSCKNEVNPEIRRRPSGGLVFSRLAGKPRGRPRQGGSQASSSRGKGLVAAASEGGQALTSRGRGGGGRGRGRGRGRTDGGRGRG